MDWPQPISIPRKVKSNLPLALNHRRDLLFPPQDRFASSYRDACSIHAWWSDTCKSDQLQEQNQQQEYKDGSDSKKEKRGWALSLVLSILS